ncbi:GBP2 [[Candida] subhashii]|uniref:GBP2 n=1 Tax=[Candida] subhashii TaxID=561895 RepID=A0A8J5QW47_9ASCO|nr:GBP2 [[Candida] subhashii]KAG7663325.1 GBP2 [[Candida] subhashii]
MDIDDYSRDRSRSPVRDRSPVRERSGSDSGAATASSSESSRSRRDYGYSSRDRGGYGSDRRGGDSRRDYGGDRRGGGGGYRGGRGSSRDFSSSNRGRDYSSSHGSSDDTYRSKTERNYDNSIFIGNIPFDCTSKDVEAIFGKEFKIARADIVTNRGRSRGMATVEFTTKDDVRDAIDKFDRFEYRGREIFVRQDYPPPEKKESFPPRREEYSRGTPRTGSRDSYNDRRGPPQPSSRDQPTKPGTEIFVGNLPFSINWQALKDIMRDAGEVVRADVRLDSWGKSRGFGTVVFNTPEEANKAIEMFQGYEIEGRKLDTRPGRTQVRPERERDSYRGNSSHEDHRQDRVSSAPVSSANTSYSSNRPALRNSEFTEGVTGHGERSDTIYVSNLPFATQNDDLYELFETVGRTTRAEIQYDPATGRASGNAVVQFELAELADNAIQNLDNYLYGGRNIEITYAKLP